MLVLAQLEAKPGSQRSEVVPQLSFFAMRDDLLPICEGVESREKIGYVEEGYRPKLDFPSFSSAALIPSLSVAKADSAVSTTRYLILDTSQKVGFEVDRIGDRDLYAVYQGVNPEGIELSPGGVFQDGILLSGRVATMGFTKRSNQLYRLYASRMKKRFTRVGAYYIGVSAYSCLERGWRLTAAVQVRHAGVRFPEREF